MWDESSNRTRIKLCEFECLDPAYEASHLGADALGFHIFQHHDAGEKARRFAEIFSYLPASVAKVLLTDVELDVLLDGILPTLRCDAIQLYPDWSAEEIGQVRQASPPDTKILKVMSAVTQENAFGNDDEFLHFYNGLVDGYLLDSFRIGGTGRTADWDHCAEIVRGTALPVFLAGGLTPGNVGEAVRTVEPFGVDVENGVSDRIPDGPLVKNMDKCRRFIAAVREADAMLGRA
ncbi:MAG: phosphoribosylanthranilate isomerase [Gemmatimonadota bacterium]|nr:MAG: phosphoribosylanthranilate isomerase [Gemmatimonadota bacterium]